MRGEVTYFLLLLCSVLAGRMLAKKKDKLLHLSYHFSLFLTVSLLSVVLWPKEGDFPESLYRVVYVIINKRSLESFMCFVHHSYFSLNTI